MSELLGQFHLESLLAAGYAIFLIGAATGLELMARLSHRRAGGFSAAGFRYVPGLDVFECPSGESLHPYELDRERRLVRYRARATVCNRCRLKSVCTDSDQGREVVRSTGSWIDSEIGRFHRGISLALVILAGLVTGAGLARHALHSIEETTLLAAVLAGVAASGWKLARAFAVERRSGDLTASGVA